ncbi:uncharacterized protein [Clytia hemisphaerica]|uniref:VWFA domain-containing protein n=3 Tax=Clytia hemisphaerica TaxID=252671 RepID=A0A7M5VEM1_9CNID
MFMNSYSQSDVHFVFIEGPLLEAIRNGHWFLLDNIGQAPGDVLERLNSLLEADPELELCEGAKMETLSRKNGKIHKEFRFISTLNTERKGSNLSTAILNRCIIINLKKLDTPLTVPNRTKKSENQAEDLQKSIETIPVFDILCQMFQHLGNTESFVSVILKFHNKMIELQKQKEIATINNYNFNVRNVLAAAKVTLSRLKITGSTLLSSLTTAIERCYFNAILKKGNTERALEEYLQILGNPMFPKEESKQTVRPSLCDSDEVCIRFGELVVAVLEAIGCFMEKCDLYSKKNSTTQLLHKVVNGTRTILESLQIPNTNLSLDNPNFELSKNLIQCIKAVVKVESFERSSKIMTKIELTENHFVSTIRTYVNNTSFADGKMKHDIVSSLLVKYHLLKFVVQNVQLLLEETHSAKNLVKECTVISTTLQRLSFLSTYRNFLSGLAKDEYRTLLSDIASKESSLKEVKSKDQDSQVLKIFIARLEQVYTTPLRNQSHSRITFLTNVLNLLVTKFGMDISKNTMQSILTAEFHGMKFHCMTKMPFIALEKPTKMFEEHKVFEIEFCGLLTGIISKSVESFNRWIKLLDSDEMAKESDVDRKALKEELMALSNEDSLLEAKNIKQSLVNFFRQNLTQYLLVQFNKGVQINLTDIQLHFDATMTKFAVDLIFFFKHVLTMFTKKWKTKLLFSKDFTQMDANYLMIHVLLENEEVAVINPFFKADIVDVTYFASIHREKSQLTDTIKFYEEYCSKRYPLREIKTTIVSVESFCPQRGEYDIISHLLTIYADKGRSSGGIVVNEENLNHLKNNVRLIMPQTTLGSPENFLDVIEELDNFFEKCEKGQRISAAESLEKLETMSEMLEIRRSSLINAMKPATIREKTQLLHLLLQEKEGHISMMKTISVLKRECYEDDVVNCLAICQLNDQLKKIINEIYLHAMRGDIKCESLKYTCSAIYLIEGCVQLLMQGFTFDNGLAKPASNLGGYLRKVEDMINTFYEEYVFYGKYSDAKFDVELVSSSEEKRKERCVVKRSPKKNDNHKLIEISEDKIVIDIQKLNDANAKAFQCGFQCFLPKISSLINELLTLPAQVNIDTLQRLDIDVLTIIKEIDVACKRAKKERNPDSLDLPWMKKPPDLEVDETTMNDLFPSCSVNITNMTEARRISTMNNEEFMEFLLGDSLLSFNDLENALTRESREEFQKWLSYRKKYPDFKAMMKGFMNCLLTQIKNLDGKENVTEFEQLLENLRKCNSLRQALNIVLRCLDDPIKQKDIGLDFQNNLKTLKKTIDLPKSLILINKIEVNVNENNIEEIENNLKELCNLLFKERLKPLRNLRFSSIESLVGFAYLGTTTLPIQLGQLWHSLLNSHQASQYLEQHMLLFRESQQPPMATMDYLYIDDFLQFFTGEPLITLLFSKQPEEQNLLDKEIFLQSVKTNFSLAGIPIINETTIDRVAESCYERTCKLTNECYEKKTSVARIIYSNLTYLHLLCDFWSDPDIEYMEDLEHGNLETMQHFFFGKENNAILKNWKVLEAKIENKKEEREILETRIRKYQGECNIDKAKECEDLRTIVESDIRKLEQEKRTDKLNYEKQVKTDIKDLKQPFVQLKKELIKIYKRIIGTVQSTCIESTFELLDAKFYYHLKQILNSTNTESEEIAKWKAVKTDIAELLTKMGKSEDAFKMEKILGHSKLNRRLQEVIEFGECTIQSLMRALGTFIDVISESEEEKTQKDEIVKADSDLKKLIQASFSELGKPSPKISTEKIKSLLETLNCLKRDFPSDGKRMTAVYIEHLIKTTRNLIRYLANDHASHFEEGFLKREEIDASDIGLVESKKLMEILETEYKTLQFEEGTIAFSTLKDVFNPVEKVFETDASSCLIELLNISYFLQKFKSFLQNALQAFTKGSSSVQLCRKTVYLLWTFVEIFAITNVAEKRSFSNVDMGQEFIEYSTTGFDSGRSSLFKLRDATEIFLSLAAENKELSEALKTNMDFFENLAVTLALKHKLKEIKGLTHLYKEADANEESILLSTEAMSLKFIGGAAKQITKYSRMAFKNQHLCGNSERRYTQIICHVLRVMETIQTSLANFRKPEMSTTLLSLVNGIPPFKDVNFFQLMRRAITTHLPILIEEICPIDCVQSCLEELTEVTEDWNQYWEELVDAKKEAKNIFYDERKKSIKETERKERESHEIAERLYTEFVQKTKDGISLGWERLIMVILLCERHHLHSKFGNLTQYTDRFLTQVNRFKNDVELKNDIKDLPSREFYQFNVALSSITCSGSISEKIDGKKVRYIIKTDEFSNEVCTIFTVDKFSFTPYMNFKSYDIKFIKESFKISSFNDSVKFTVTFIEEPTEDDDDAEVVRVLFQTSFTLLYKEWMLEEEEKVGVDDKFVLKCKYNCNKTKKLNTSAIPDDIKIHLLEEADMHSAGDVTDFMKNSLQEVNRSIYDLRSIEIVKPPGTLVQTKMKQFLEKINRNESLVEDKSPIVQQFQEMASIMERAVQDMRLIYMETERDVREINEPADMIPISAQLAKLIQVRKSFIESIKEKLKALRRDKNNRFINLRKIRSEKDFICTHGEYAFQLKDIWSDKQAGYVHKVDESTQSCLNDIGKQSTDDYLKRSITLLFNYMMIQDPKATKEGPSILRNVFENMKQTGNRASDEKNIQLISSLHSKEKELSMKILDVQGTDENLPDFKLDILKMYVNKSKIVELDLDAVSADPVQVEFNSHVHGIPTVETKQIVITSHEACSFEFGKLQKFKLSKSHGNLFENEQIVVYFSPNLKTGPTIIDDRCDEVATLNISRAEEGTPSKEVNLALIQQIDHVDPLKHLKCPNGTFKTDDNGGFVLDIGDATFGRSVTCQFLLSNHLNSSLRLKFASKLNQCTFDKNESILRHQGKDEVSMTLFVDAEEKSFQVYFSESVSFVFSVKHTIVQPSVKLLYKEQPFEGSSKFISKSYIPFTENIFDELRIRNDGTCRLKTLIQLLDDNNNTLLEGTIFLESLEDFQPTLQVNARNPKAMTTYLDIHVFDSNEVQIRKAHIKLSLNIGWPEIKEISPLLFKLKPKDSPTTKEISISASYHPVEIYSIESFGMKCVNTQLPVTIRQGRPFKLSISVRPQIGVTEGILILHTNCQIPRQVFRISFQVSKLPLVTSHKVLDVSNRSKAEVIVSNTTQTKLSCTWKGLSIYGKRIDILSDDSKTLIYRPEYNSSSHLVRLQSSSTGTSLEFPVVKLKSDTVPAERLSSKFDASSYFVDLIASLLQESKKFEASTILPFAFKAILNQDIYTLDIVIKDLKSKKEKSGFLSRNFSTIFKDDKKELPTKESSRSIAYDLCDKIGLYPLKAMLEFASNREVLGLHELLSSLFTHYFAENQDGLFESLQLLPRFNVQVANEKMKWIVNVLHSMPFNSSPGVSKAASLLKVLLEKNRLSKSRYSTMQISEADQFEKDFSKLFDKITEISKLKSHTQMVDAIVNVCGAPLITREELSDIKSAILSSDKYKEIEEVMKNKQGDVSLTSISETIHCFGQDKDDATMSKFFETLTATDHEDSYSVFRAALNLLDDNNTKQDLESLVDRLQEFLSVKGLEGEDSFIQIWDFVKDICGSEDGEQEAHDIPYLKEVFFALCEGLDFFASITSAEKIIGGEARRQDDLSAKQALDLLSHIGTTTLLSPVALTFDDLLEQVEKYIVEAEKSPRKLKDFFSDFRTKYRDVWKHSVEKTRLMAICKQAELDGVMVEFLRCITVNESAFETLPVILDEIHPKIAGMLNIAKYVHSKIVKDSEQVELLDSVDQKEEIVDHMENVKSTNVVEAFLELCEYMCFPHEQVDCIAYILENLAVRKDTIIFKFFQKLKGIIPQDVSIQINRLEHFIHAEHSFDSLQKKKFYLADAISILSRNSTLNLQAGLLTVANKHVHMIRKMGFQRQSDVYNALIGYEGNCPSLVKLLSLAKSLHISVHKYHNQETYDSNDVCFLDWLLSSPLKFHLSTMNMVQISKYLLLCSISRDSKPSLIKMVCQLSFVSSEDRVIFQNTALLRDASQGTGSLERCLSKMSYSDCLSPDVKRHFLAMSKLYKIKIKKEDEVDLEQTLDFLKVFCNGKDSIKDILLTQLLSMSKPSRSCIAELIHILSGSNQFFENNTMDIEVWKQVFQLDKILKTILNSNTSISNGMILELSSTMARISNQLSQEEIVQNHSNSAMQALFLSMFSMTLYESKISFVQNSLVTLSVITFQFVTTNLYKEVTEYRKDQLRYHDEIFETANISVQSQMENKIFITNLPLQQTTTIAPESQTPCEQSPRKLEVPPKSKESLDVVLQKIKKELLESENILRVINSFDFWKQTCEEAYGLRIDLPTLTSIIEECNKFDVKMRNLLEVLMIHFQVVEYFSDEETRIFKAAINRWKVIQVVQLIWEASQINGMLKSVFRQLQDTAKKNLAIMLDCIEDEKQEIFKKTLKSFGINLKLKNTVYEYEIPKPTTLEEIHQQVNHSIGDTSTRRRGTTTSKIAGQIFISAFTTNDLDSNFGNQQAVLQDSDFLPVDEREKNRSENIYEENKKTNTKFVESTSIQPYEGSAADLEASREPGAKVVSFTQKLDGSSKQTSLSVTFSWKDRGQFKQQVKHDWIKELGEDTDDRPSAVSEFEGCEELDEEEKHKLRYTYLAKVSRQFQTACIRIMTEIKRMKDGKVVHVRQQVSHKQINKFVFLVDNSGSMNGEKLTLALNILIVLLESLKRMEYQTAVVRFGGSQVPLKEFTQKMDQSRGQRIIESFDSSENTVLDDAISFVTTKEQLFGYTKRSNENRYLVLITDGICTQTDAAKYLRLLKSVKDLHFLVLTTLPNKNERFYESSFHKAKTLLDKIAPGNWRELNPETDFMVTIKAVAELIDNNLRDDAKKSSGPALQEYSNLERQLVSCEEPTSFVNKFEEFKDLDVAWGKSVMVSDINKPLTESFRFLDERIVERFKSHYESKIAVQLNNLPPPTLSSDMINKKASAITEKEEEVLVSSLTDVLDTIALPNNRPTRLLQDYRGSSFSIPGYIKFVCSDGQYKKIYENLIGSPRKDYRVTIIVDVSQSMAGMAEIGATSIIISLAAALQNINVLFSIITSGSVTKLVKDFNDEWDNKTKAKLYDALTFDQDETNLSDSIFYATQLITDGASSKVGKTIIVLTDGYPSAPKKLQTSLYHAESMNVQTLAIGIGYFTEGIFEYFPYFVLADDPKLLPGALQSFYLGEQKLEGLASAAGRVVTEKVLYNEKQLANMDEAWDLEMDKIYLEEYEKSKRDLTLRVFSVVQAATKLKIRLCFVLDTTGSMGGYIEMAKNKIQVITENIKKRIFDESKRDADLQIGFIGYKVRGQVGHLDKIPFTSDLAALQSFINSQRASGGSWDTGYEDKEDALLGALEFKWSEWEGPKEDGREDGTVKFLVLIADYPDRGTVGTMFQTVQKYALKNIYFLFVTILPGGTDILQKERGEMRQAYQSTAKSKIKDKGFMEINMNDIGNDTNQLSEKIVDKVNEVVMVNFM